MKNLYEKLLIEYCDALISLQDRGRDKAFHGGIFCRACKMIHGRCPDAVYGFLTAAKITGDKKYVRAAKNVFDYGENMFCSDGSMYNDAQANWRYTTPTALVTPSPVYTTVAKPAEEEKPSVDLSDVVVGTAVTHAKFGDGKIANIDKAGKYIRVAFSVGEKTFAGNAFEQGFLKLKR